MRWSERLREILPQDLLRLVPGRFQIIGDIAILSLPPQARDYRIQIAQAVLSQGKGIRMVLNKTSKLKGDRRIAAFEILWGPGSTITTHKENGFAYRLDVARAFFNSRLGYERMRVAEQTSPGEWVLVLFAGVGPFVVPLAARGARVLAVEMSQEACGWLAENARLNRAEERIDILNSDAFRLPLGGRTAFDRIVITTPYGRDHILQAVSNRVLPGGSVHFYTFKRPEQIEGLARDCGNLGLEVQFSRRCGNVAPGVSRWALDMVKR